MDRWQSHKVVEAGEIRAGEVAEDRSSRWSVEGGEIIDAPPGLVGRGVPAEGDFLVRYPGDGYLSWSPRQAFLDGYTLVPEIAPPTGPADPLGVLCRVCHEALRAWALGWGDPSLLPWDAAPEWQRKATLDGVLFLLANPDAGPGAAHVAWGAAKREDGWVYGPVKDAEAKTHPLLVPFSDLSLFDRMKDVIFVATVRAVAQADALDEAPA